MLSDVCFEFKKEIDDGAALEDALDELEEEVTRYADPSWKYPAEVTAALKVAIASVREGNFSVEMLVEMTELVRTTYDSLSKEEDERAMIRGLDAMLAAEPR